MVVVHEQISTQHLFLFKVVFFLPSTITCISTNSAQVVYKLSINYLKTEEKGIILFSLKQPFKTRKSLVLIKKLWSVNLFVLCQWLAHLRWREWKKKSVFWVYFTGLTVKIQTHPKHQLYLNILNVICLNMFVFLVELKMFFPGVFEGTFELK
jgi:hypothetical protein